MFDRIVSSHDLIPSVVETDLWRLPIGLGLGNDQVGPDIRAATPLAVLGENGSGKTNALLQLGVSALIRGFSVVVIDRQDGGDKYLTLLPHLHCLAVTENELARLLLFIDRIVLQRTRACARHDVDNVEDLPKSRKESVLTNPILIVIDGLDSVSSQLRTSVDELISDPLLSSLNIFIAFATERPRSKSTSSEAHLNTKSDLMLKPRFSSDDISDLFVDRTAEAAYANAGLAYEGVGFGLYESPGQTLRGVEIADTQASDLSEILAKFRVPQREQWDVIEPRTIERLW
jgi:hypothetical protein